MLRSSLQFYSFVCICVLLLPVKAVPQGRTVVPCTFWLASLHVHMRRKHIFADMKCIHAFLTGQRLTNRFTFPSKSTSVLSWAPCPMASSQKEHTISKSSCQQRKQTSQDAWEHGLVRAHSPTLARRLHLCSCPCSCSAQHLSRRRASENKWDLC